LIFPLRPCPPSFIESCWVSIIISHRYRYIIVVFRQVCPLSFFSINYKLLSRSDFSRTERTQRSDPDRLVPSLGGSVWSVLWWKLQWARRGCSDVSNCHPSSGDHGIVNIENRPLPAMRDFGYDAFWNAISPHVHEYRTCWTWQGRWYSPKRS
jgi:hypothetical protein